jgi:hypothetical protein
MLEFTEQERHQLFWELVQRHVDNRISAKSTILALEAIGVEVETLYAAADELRSQRAELGLTTLPEETPEPVVEPIVAKVGGGLKINFAAESIEFSA